MSMKAFRNVFARQKVTRFTDYRQEKVDLKGSFFSSSSGPSSSPMIAIVVEIFSRFQNVCFVTCLALIMRFACRMIDSRVGTWVFISLTRSVAINKIIKSVKTSSSSAPSPSSELLFFLLCSSSSSSSNSFPTGSKQAWQSSQCRA